MRRVFSPAVAVIAVIAALAASTAMAADRCRVTDPTGTPLNVRDGDMKILGKLEHGRIVIVKRTGEDAHGNPWALVETPNGDRIGWVYREFISCF